jgi:hypothetical protein
LSLLVFAIFAAFLGVRLPSTAFEAKIAKNTRNVRQAGLAGMRGTATTINRT